jgi:hypothetical protein
MRRHPLLDPLTAFRARPATMGIRVTSIALDGVRVHMGLGGLRLIPWLAWLGH